MQESFGIAESISEVIYKWKERRNRVDRDLSSLKRVEKAKSAPRKVQGVITN